MTRAPRAGAVLAALVAAAAHLAGCGGSEPGAAVPTRRARVDTGPLFESPARWIAHPGDPGEPTAALPLGDGTCLVVTDRGERWIVRGTDTKAPCRGPGRASGASTVESLVAVQRAGETYRFVAMGGVVYTAESPLGPLTRATRAPTYLRRVAARGDTIVGVDAAGATWFFDEGWQRARLDATARAFDVAVDDAGRVLWLGLPETLRTSTDGGRTYAAPTAAPATVGALGVGRTLTGELAVTGAAGNLVWRRDGTFTPAPPPLTLSGTVDAAIEPGRGPSASAVRDGTAAFAGRRYVEVVERAEEPLVGLFEGELGGPLVERPLPGLTCAAQRIGLSNDATVVACMNEDQEKGDVVVTLHDVTHSAASTAPFATLRALALGEVALAVGPGGSTLVTGVCGAPPPVRDVAKGAREDDAPDDARPDAGCVTNAATWVKRDARGVEIVTGRAAQSGESAQSPVVSPDGRLLYFVSRTRRDAAAVFVSRDGGRTYLARVLEAPGSATSLAHEGDWEDGGDEARALSWVGERPRLTIDEAGVLGLGVELDTGTGWVTLDPDGHVASLARPPSPGVALAGQGQRVFAAGYGEDESLHAWESLDGGVGFAELPSSPGLIKMMEGDGPFVCAAPGCLLGDEYGRLGWEGQAEPLLSVPEDVPPVVEATLGEVVACEVVGEPARFAGLGEDLRGGPRLPQLFEVARGRFAWSTLLVDPERGGVEVISAALPERDGPPGAVTRKPLLPPLPKAKERPPLLAKNQAEGFVALRARPGDAAAGYDVAWQNQVLGVEARRRVKLPGAPRAVPGARLEPELLTVTMRGLVARPGAPRASLFVDERGERAVDYPAWAGLALPSGARVRSDAAFAGGAPMGLAFADEGTETRIVALTPLLAPGAPAGPTFARAIGHASADVLWLYDEAHAGVGVVSADPMLASPPSAVGFWFDAERGLGEPFPLPSLDAAEAAPRPCSADERHKTARVTANHFSHGGVLLYPTGRRAVVVSEAAPDPSDPLSAPTLGGPVWLLGDGGVLHGTAGSPCVAALRASGMTAGVAAVLTADRKHGWLFSTGTAPPPAPPRPSAGPRAPSLGASVPRAQGLEVRTLRCAPQRDRSVPSEVVERISNRLPEDRP